MKSPARAHSKSCPTRKSDSSSCSFVAAIVSEVLPPKNFSNPRLTTTFVRRARNQTLESSSPRVISAGPILFLRWKSRIGTKSKKDSRKRFWVNGWSPCSFVTTTFSCNQNLLMSFEANYRLTSLLPNDSGAQPLHRRDGSGNHVSPSRRRNQTPFCSQAELRLNARGRAAGLFRRIPGKPAGRESVPASGC